METKTVKLSLVLLVIITFFMACNDDEETIVRVEERDRAEQQLADKDSLIAYLSTHYYNSSFFETGTNHEFSNVIFTELPKDDDGNYLDMPNPTTNTLLIDAIETYTTTYLDVNYEYYVLRLNQGGGNAPKFTDAIRYRFEGSSIVVKADNNYTETSTVFQSIVTPHDLSLQTDGFNFGSIRAWQLAIPTFNAAQSYENETDGNDNPTGLFNYDNYGLGVMFVPSGLAYFSSTTLGFPAYSNLIFKFEVLQVQVEDHEDDGVPSYLEDLDNSQDVFDDDTDEDNIPNFIDIDDDGDGILSINEHQHSQYIITTTENEPVLSINEFEISRDEANGLITINTITLVDSNTDGIFDYLDANIAVDNNVFNDN